MLRGLCQRVEVGTSLSWTRQLESDDSPNTEKSEPPFGNIGLPVELCRLQTGSPFLHHALGPQQPVHDNLLDVVMGCVADT